MGQCDGQWLCASLLPRTYSIGVAVEVQEQPIGGGAYSRLGTIQTGVFGDQFSQMAPAPGPTRPPSTNPGGGSGGGTALADAAGDGFDCRVQGGDGLRCGHGVLTFWWKV